MNLYGLIISIIYQIIDKWYRRKQIDDFQSKSVFITGTDSGFGKSLAVELDNKGLRVYAGCYTQEGEEQLRQESSKRLRTIRIDVTKRETILAARDFIVKDLGPNEDLWGLVNNAGIMKGVLVDFCTMEDYRETMEVNFFGVINTTEIFMPLMKKSRGRIINVVGINGRVSNGLEPFCCSKHAVKPYTDGLRRSMETFGVHVATIEPGTFLTNSTTSLFSTDELERSWKNLPNNVKEEYGEEFKEGTKKCLIQFSGDNQPFYRRNKMEDVMAMISHSLSSTRPKARYVCGKDAYLMARTLTIWPDWIQDFIFRYQIPYNKVVGKV